MAVERFKTQILILHPEETALRACVRELDHEYSVHVATSGRDALAILDRTPVDLFVSTNDLAGMSGLEALQEAAKRSAAAASLLLVNPELRDDEIDALLRDAPELHVARCGSSTEELMAAVVDGIERYRVPGMRLGAAAGGGAVTSNTTSSMGRLQENEEVVFVSVDSDAGHEPQPTNGSPDKPFFADNEQDRQFTSTVSELPTAGLRTHAGGRQIEVLILTQDERFRETIRDAAKSGHKVHHALTLQEAIDVIELGRVGVLVTDAALAPGEVEAITSRLRRIEPALVTIVAGRRDDGDALMGLISSGSVYRFLLKPVSAGRARLAIESSVKRCMEYRLDPPQSTTRSPVQSAVRETIAHFALDEEKRPRTGRIAGAGTALVAALLAGIWLASGSGEQPTDIVPAMPQAQNRELAQEIDSGTQVDTTVSGLGDENQPIDPAGVEELRRQALEAKAQGRIAMPDDSNALTLYGRATQAGPASEGLKTEFDDVIAEALTLGERALIDGQLDEAAQLIGRVREVRPNQPRLPFLETQLRKEQSRSLIAAARASVADGDLDSAIASVNEAEALAPAGDPAIAVVREEISATRAARELREILERAGERLATRQLTAPEDDNARAYYNAALERDQDNSTAKQGLMLVATALLQDAEKALERSSLDRARTLVAEARETGASERDAQAILQKIEAAETASASEAAPELEPRSTALTDATEVPAAGESEDALENETSGAGLAEPATTDTDVSSEAAPELMTNVDNTAPALQRSELIRSVYVQPRYPRAAVRRGISGWVDLAFTVTEEGKVTDIEVVSAEPSRVFNRAAVDALSRWEYQPVIEDGVAVEQRTNVRMQFNVTD